MTRILDLVLRFLTVKVEGKTAVNMENIERNSSHRVLRTWNIRVVYDFGSNTIFVSLAKFI